MSEDNGMSESMGGNSMAAAKTRTESEFKKMGYMPSIKPKGMKMGMKSMARKPKMRSVKRGY